MRFLKMRCAIGLPALAFGGTMLATDAFIDSALTAPRAARAQNTAGSTLQYRKSADADRRAGNTTQADGILREVAVQIAGATAPSAPARASVTDAPPVVAPHITTAASTSPVDRVWSQAGCAPPAEPSFLAVDASGFQAHKTADFTSTRNIDFAVRTFSVFAVKELRRQGAGWAIQVYVDDDLRWIEIPPARLWEVRFGITEDEFISLSDSDPLRGDTMIGVVPCAFEERRDRARAMLERGFTLLQKKEYAAAAEMFLAGVRLDSKNGAGVFYLAEAMRLNGDEDWKTFRYYQRAQELPLTADLAALALEQTLRIERAADRAK